MMAHVFNSIKNVFWYGLSTSLHVALCLTGSKQDCTVTEMSCGRRRRTNRLSSGMLLLNRFSVGKSFSDIAT